MKKILIVEDEEFLIDAYRTKLGDEDYELEIAMDGVEGLEAMRTTKPDIVILDLILPRKDGYEVLEEKSVDPDIKDIPVIVASNIGEEFSFKRVKMLGAVDYFVKSNITISDLADKIKKHLS
jgi:two-component system chemotaxis response regulator CheY